MKAMTEKQREIWLEMVRAQVRDGRPASMREIAAAVGLASTNSVHEQLQRIAKKGYATNREPGATRSWVAHARTVEAP